MLRFIEPCNNPETPWWETKGETEAIVLLNSGSGCHAISNTFCLDEYIRPVN